MTRETPRIVVCAGNAAEADHWARHFGIPRSQYTYASSTRVIDGMTHFSVVRLPGFFDRADAARIDAVIRMAEGRLRF